MTTSFSLESVLGWPFRRRLEQVSCLPRAAAVLLAAALWLAGGHGPAGRHDLQGAVVALAILAAAADAALVFRRPDLARRAWPGYALADLGLVLLYIASAPQPAALLPLLFVAAASLPPRLPLAGSIAAGALSTALSLWLAGPGEAPIVVLIASAFLLQALVSQLVKGHGLTAGRDPLTGAFGRGHILAEMRRLIAEHAYPFALILTDLDGFKQVNDQLGHAAGDRVLQAVVRHIASSIRGSDLLARYGGDEFRILLAATDGATASLVVDRLVAAVADGPLDTTADAGITLAVSAGAIEAQPGQSLHDLLHAVDQRLYVAKRAQRRVSSRMSAS